MCRCRSQLITVLYGLHSSILVGSGFLATLQPNGKYGIITVCAEMKSDNRAARAHAYKLDKRDRPKTALSLARQKKNNTSDNDDDDVATEKINKERHMNQQLRNKIQLRPRNWELLLWAKKYRQIIMTAKTLSLRIFDIWCFLIECLNDRGVLDRRIP